jgi:DNA-directed RNA polymerase specialized sigma24 family protein
MTRDKYAFGLIPTDTARQIERRVQARRTGKVWRYTERQLSDALEACSAWWAAKRRLPAGERFAPLVSEFDQWREQELELARARGDHGLELPSATPYRRRWNTWEDALVHFGFTPDQLAERLARIPEPVPPPVPERDMPAGLPAAELTDDTPDGLDPAFATAVRDAYRGLPARARFILTARLGLGGAPARSFREIGPALHVHFTTVHLAERRAIATLQAACSPAGRLTDRERIAHALRLLTGGSRSSVGRQ